MILGIVYILAGVFVLLVASGLVQSHWLPDRTSGSRTTVRLAMVIFGFGLLILGLYYSRIYWNRMLARSEAYQSSSVNPVPAPASRPGQNSNEDH